MNSEAKIVLTYSANLRKDVYVVKQATNYIDHNPGDTVSREAVQAMIMKGMTVVITKQ